MEGNLTRARGPNSEGSGSSMSSSGSTPSPTMIRSATALQETSHKGHGRGLSDSSPSNLPSPTYLRRSASALGAAGGYRKPLTGSRSTDNLGSRLNKRQHRRRHHGLEPLGENSGLDGDEPGEPRSDDGYLLSPTDSTSSENGYTRSVSVAQMRGLQDQMTGLKGKIANLRDQARADSMKRRSVQSLRTPSPFTHARWDHGYLGDGSKTATEKSSSNSERNPGSKSSDKGEDSKATGKVGILEDATPTANQTSQGDSSDSITEEDPFEGFSQDERFDDEDDDMRTEDGHQVDEEMDVDHGQEVEEEEFEEAEATRVEEREGQMENFSCESESGESLYEDALQAPVSHEDREDAFDYEHFFLHSAMGTISQQRLARRERSGSISSEDSVETTRAIPPTASPPKEMHMRKKSEDSISTLESFATAEEGRMSSRSSLQLQDDARHLISRNGAIEEEDEDEPLTAKRHMFAHSQSSRSTSSLPSRNGGRPMSTTSAILHRPSLASFESTGTQRSFPLVNKPRSMTIGTSSASINGGTGILTPRDSPDQEELRYISDQLMDDTASIYEEASAEQGGEVGSAKMQQMLAAEDQVLVERLVESLGKCVLGMGENERAGTDSRMYRRRIDAARRVLEGLEAV